MDSITGQHIACTGTGHCPVRGKISVKGNISDVCSAPYGAGDTQANEICYRCCAPDGAGGPFMDTITGQHFAFNGSAHCPVWGKRSVDKIISIVCSAPYGAGDTHVNEIFYLSGDANH